MKTTNNYSEALGDDFYSKTPKAVVAAIAVSFVTLGGDYMREVDDRVLREWTALYDCGIVPQKPPRRVEIDDVGSGLS